MNDGVAQINKNIRQELYVKYGVVNPIPARKNCDSTKIIITANGINVIAYPMG